MHEFNFILVIGLWEDLVCSFVFIIFFLSYLTKKQSFWCAPLYRAMSSYYKLYINAITFNYLEFFYNEKNAR